MYTTLQRLKRQVKAEEFDRDDAYLCDLCDAAEAMIERVTNRTLDELADGGDRLPVDIERAVLLLVGLWYDTREAAGSNLNEMPYGVSALLTPYIRLTRGDCV